MARWSPHVVLLLFVAAAAAQRLSEGEACKAGGGEAGVCREVTQCPQARLDISRGLRPAVCSFVGYRPIVCCPQAVASTTRGTTAGTRGTTAGTPKATTATQKSQPAARSKSQQKCEEWGRAVFRLERSPVLLQGDPLVNRSLCAVATTPLIIGGVPAEEMEFPHMAGVGYGPENKVQYLCGGSLISERWVLTAAHCAEDYTRSGIGPPRWIRVGDLSPEGSGDHSSAQDFRIERRVSHPDYRHPIKDNDVALLRLDHDAVFNEFVRPACLYTSPDVSAVNAIATGWGKTERAGWSEELLKVKLPLTEQSKCAAIFQKLVDSSASYRNVLPGGIRDSMLCAGEPAGGKDTCQGDSGGPLQVLNESPFCTYSILGLVSFGKGCAQPGYPAVYTRVSSFVPWIESVVWP